MNRINDALTRELLVLRRGAGPVAHFSDAVALAERLKTTKIARLIIRAFEHLLKSKRLFEPKRSS